MTIGNWLFNLTRFSNLFAIDLISSCSCSQKLVSSLYESVIKSTVHPLSQYSESYQKVSPSEIPSLNNLHNLQNEEQEYWLTCESLSYPTVSEFEWDQK